jgi:hypothetical protein
MEHDNAPVQGSIVRQTVQQCRYWGRTMSRRAFSPFTCPNCKALYEVVKVEAGPETADREITCQVCGSPLVGREGKLVLKYFLLREAVRRTRQGRAKAV